MRDSAKSAEWVAKVVAANPITKIMNAQGQWDGNIRTCPVRLNFFNNSLHTAVVGKNDDGTPRTTGVFEIQMLFPPCAGGQVSGILRPAVSDKMRAVFPSATTLDPNTGLPYGLHSPLRMQDEKQNFAGFTPGGFFIRATTQYKPPIVDTANNPIVDTSRAYPGVWAMVSINLFDYGVRPPRPKKGVSFGLQAVMLIADDTPLVGGGVDTKTQFAGVNISGDFDPSSAFGSAAPKPRARTAADLLGNDDIPF